MRKAKQEIKNLKKFISPRKSFPKSQLAMFVIGFGLVGAYILSHGFAASDCTSYPSVPAGTASINLCPTSIDHTLPAKFWGYGISRYFYGDLTQPQYQQLFRQVAPEVVRDQEGQGQSPGTPSAPDPFLKNYYTLAQTMKSQGLDLGVILMMESGPSSLPSGTTAATINNYDQTGSRSPANHGAMVNWFMDGGIDVLGYEAYNEPGNDSNWYSGTTQTIINEREAWAYIHQRQFADGVHQALSAKGRSTKILGGVLGTGEGYGAGWAQNFFSGSGTLINDGGGWPWATNNIASTNYGPIFDTYIFHPYPANGDNQSGLNSLLYPTLTTNYQSDLYAFMETERNYLNNNGGAGKQLAFDEGGYDLNTNEDALAEGLYAVIMAREQSHWNVPFYTLWSGNTTSSGGQNIWPLFLTSDHVNFRHTIKSSAARDITGKFLHNYKRQIAGHGSTQVINSGLTPGGNRNNPVPRIQASAGLNADGSKMAILAVNLDMTNSQTIQINLGTTATGPVAATYMLENTPVGSMPTTTIPATNTFTRTLEPGSEYLFEVPISGTSTPPPAVNLTASPVSVPPGSSSILSWNSTNASSCSAAGGWTASTAVSGSQSVSPSSTTTYTISCTGPGGSGSASTTVTVNLPAVTIPGRSVSHSVDGNLNESDWNLSKTVSKTISGSTADSGAWGAVWDSNYLYVGVKVSDNSLSTASGFTAGNYWQNDSVEVYLDPKADRGTTYDSFDKQLAQVWNDNGLYGVSSGTSGVLHAWAPVAGGYSVEMAIPWTSLGMTPANGSNLGIDVGINDSVNGTRAGQLMWNGTANNWQDPSGFGSASLSGTPAAIPGDANGDGKVDVVDLSILLSHYGTNYAAADFNGDGTVSVLDLSILLSNYS